MVPQPDWIWLKCEGVGIGDDSGINGINIYVITQQNIKMISNNTMSLSIYKYTEITQKSIWSSAAVKYIPAPTICPKHKSMNIQ